MKETVEHKKKVKKVKTARSANAIPMSKHANGGQASRAFIICFQTCFHPLSIGRAKTADDVGDLHSPVASLEPETPVEDQISINFQSFRPPKNCKQLIPFMLTSDGLVTVSVLRLNGCLRKVPTVNVGKAEFSETVLNL